MSNLKLPSSLLGYHRQLAPSAAVKVSPLCLGAMTFGSAWEKFMGSCPKNTAFDILDYFYSQGGNFIDTASNYQNGESETWVGEWMAERGNRDEMVIATKFTSGWMAHLGDKVIQSNYGGSHTKTLKLSVHHSLKKLQTDYIDILYLHWWDYSISIPELMHALNDLVVQGKIHYLGISDTPAWIVAQANAYARQHHLRPFVVYQGKYSASLRDMERDIMPMCRSENMGIATWNSLGGGVFRTEAQRAKVKDGRNYIVPTPADLKMCTALETVAERKGPDTPLTSIALSYVMHKQAYLFPLVGARTVAQLQSNIAALSLQLTQQDVDEIEGAVDFDVGFPHNLLGTPTHRSGAMTSSALKLMAKQFGHFDYVEMPGFIQNGIHSGDVEEALKAESTTGSTLATHKN